MSKVVQIRVKPQALKSEWRIYTLQHSVVVQICGVKLLDTCYSKR